MPTNTTITILPDDTILSVIRAIHELDPIPKNITIDTYKASFAIGYDFFVLLTRRFPGIHFTLLTNDTSIMAIASSFSIKTTRSSVTSEFEEHYTKKQSSLIKHNYTRWEYFLYEVKRFFEYIFFIIKRKPKTIYSSKSKLKSTNFVLMIFGLIMSLSLLLFIFYFAVSKTTIVISPQINVTPVVANVIFTSTGKTALDGANVLEMRPVTQTVESTMKFRVTALDMNTIHNSQGTITVYNELTAEQTMKPNTRFVTDDGLIFRSLDWITVPGAKSINGIASPGMTDITVIADQYDENNTLVGLRGNIPDGTVLTIPGLVYNRDKIYAKAKGSFAGGDNPKLHVVTQTEVDSFMTVFREQLKATAKEEIQKAINTLNKETGREFSLLVADTIKYSDENIGLLNDVKIGDYAEEVEIGGKIQVQAYAFDKRGAIQYLTDIFHEKLLQGTDKELGINEDTLRVSNVIDRNESGDRIKVTIEMNTVTTYDFENSANELTRQLKALIIGLSASEAEKRLKSDGHIGKATIYFSPFWLRSVSSNPDNIEFVIEKNN